MGSVKDYFSSLGSGIASLLKGMQVTGKEFITPKITEQYPENRDTVKVPDRFRAVLELKYDSEGRHKCIACGICERNCPNGTISLTTKMVDTPDGKKKRKLDTYSYDLGSCTFCQLCVTSCPQDALEFSNDFEQAVFTREKLVRKLNYLPEKKSRHHLQRNWLAFRQNARLRLLPQKQQLPPRKQQLRQRRLSMQSRALLLIISVQKKKIITKLQIWNQLEVSSCMW